MLQKLFGSEEKIRKQQLELISLLNRWYQVKEDLLYAFEKCGDSDIGQPTKTNIKDFIVRIRGGLSIERSLDLFSQSYTNSEFKNFITQIRFNMKYRGNTGELLDNLETQFGKIDEEWTRRKIESSKDRRYINLIFISTPIISTIVFNLKPTAYELFFIQPIGKLLIPIALISYLGGLAVYYFSLKQKYE